MAPYYQFFVVASTLIQIISNQCLPHEWCSNVRDSQAKCCTTLTSNATSSVDLVTAETKTTAHSPPIVQKTNFSLKVNTDIISCGRQMLDNNKIVGGCMLLEIQSQCAGSVIQRKYILTAAQCLAGRILYVMGKLYKVRLGEHDLSTDPDCMANSFSAPNAVDIDILSTHPHPKYQSKAKSSFDIGLIKLVDEIPYNDYIQLICYDQNVDFVGHWFYVAGCGKTEAGKIGLVHHLRHPNIVKSKSLCGTFDYPALYTRIDMHL